MLDSFKDDILETIKYGDRNEASSRVNYLSGIMSEIPNVLDTMLQKTFPKINLDTRKIRNNDKIYEAYNIPKDEEILAYIKSTAIVFTLSRDGNIITDKAFYFNPRHSSWGTSNRIPISDICQYVIIKPNDHSETKAVSANDIRTLCSNNLFGKNKVADDIYCFLRKLQSIMKSQYDWAVEQYSEAVQDIFEATNRFVRIGELSDDFDDTLTELSKSAEYVKESYAIKAEYIYRQCSPDAYNEFIDSIEEAEIREMCRNNESVYYDRLKNDISEVNAEFNLDFLKTMLNNLNSRKKLSQKEIFVAVYVSARLHKETQFEKFIDLLAEKSEEKLKPKFFKGLRYNIDMRQIYDEISKDRTPSEEYYNWTDSLGLTPLHYAIILKNNNTLENLLDYIDKTKSAFHNSEYANTIFDYTLVAICVGSQMVRNICRCTDMDVKKKQQEIDELWNELHEYELMINNEEQNKNSYIRHSQMNEEQYGEPDYYLDDILEEANKKIESYRNHISYIKSCISSREVELKRLIESRIAHHQNKLNEYKNSGNSYLRFIISLFKDQHLLQHVLYSNSDDCIMYIYDNKLFVTPTDIKIKLEYYDSNFNKHVGTEDDYRHSNAAGLEYDGKWFSPEAYRNEKKLKEEYLRLAKKYHPDTNNNPESTKIFQEISNERDKILEQMNL